MEIIWKCTVFLTLFMVTASNGWRNRNNDSAVQNNDFDIFVYSLNWPQTGCYSIKKIRPQKTCNMPDTNRWTVHGLWPMKLGKFGPENCDRTLRFNTNNLKSIESDLKANWQGRDASKAQDWLWKHEWKKHGSCSAILEALNSMEKYFAKGLELYRKYNLTETLEKADIVPGRRYHVNDLLNEVTKNFGKRGFASCIYNKNTKEHYLSEIRLCFDKSLNLVDCDGIHGFPTSCPMRKQFYFPDEVPSYL